LARSTTKQAELDLQIKLDFINEQTPARLALSSLVHISSARKRAYTKHVTYSYHGEDCENLKVCNSL